jgi:uncharacterized membrane protein
VTESQLRPAIGALALAGLAIASYLTYARYSGTQLYCATGGCETVQHSRYAVIAGIPVAVLGLAAYGAVLGTAIAPGSTAAALGFGLAAAGVVFSAYLLVAQLFLIHAVCQWCVASDVVVTLLAIATWARFVLAQRAVPAAA